ncbi:MAG: hypothetical protein ABR521_01280 [Gaiellaceae bacterium]
MDEPEREPEIDESGRNPTQRRLDEEGPSEQPADVPWDEPLPVVSDAGAESEDEPLPPERI